MTLVSGSDGRLVADIEKLLKKKIEIEALEYDEDRPRGRINDGRRHWRDAEGGGDDSVEGNARGERAARAPRSPSRYAPAAPRDPFFEQPYETPADAPKPSWEAAERPSTGRVSPNIKPKRKVAALFKAQDSVA